MVYAVQIDLEFATAVVRDTTLLGLQTRIGSKSRFGVLRTDAVTARSGNHGLVVDVRFTARADMEDLKAWLEATAVGPNAPLAGSRVRIHECSHDAADPQPCTIEAETIW